MKAKHVAVITTWCRLSGGRTGSLPVLDDMSTVLVLEKTIQDDFEVRTYEQWHLRSFCADFIIPLI